LREGCVARREVLNNNKAPVEVRQTLEQYLFVDDLHRIHHHFCCAVQEERGPLQLPRLKRRNKLTKNTEKIIFNKKIEQK